MQISFLIFLFQVLIIQSEIQPFTQSFKQANTMPEFKKWEKSLKNNYWLVHLKPYLSKIFE